MLAGIVFLFILSLTIVYSNETANRVALAEKGNARDLAAITTGQALVYSRGEPAYWETLPDLNNVSSLGLSRGGWNELSAEKFQRLSDLNSTHYIEIKDLLGLSRYGLKISVLDLQTKQSIAEFGLEPSEGDEVSAVNRIAFYNGTDILLRVKVFE